MKNGIGYAILFFVSKGVYIQTTSSATAILKKTFFLSELPFFL